ncbi:MAG: DUF1569 domain-containing protein [Planctomycetota bacterium]
MKNTKQIQGRRELNYADFGEMLADIEAMVAKPHAAIGNWTVAENIEHCAMPIGWAMDGYPEGFSVPWYFKVIGPLFRKSFLTMKPSPPGIKPPTKMAAFFKPRPDVTTDEAMARLRSAVARWPETPTIPKNPLVGSLTKAEWERFLCNHAALHFSFIVSASGSEPDQGEA